MHDRGEGERCQKAENTGLNIPSTFQWGKLGCVVAWACIAFWPFWIGARECDLGAWIFGNLGEHSASNASFERWESLEHFELNASESIAPGVGCWQIANWRSLMQTIVYVTGMVPNENETWQNVGVAIEDIGRSHLYHHVWRCHLCLKR